MNYFVFWMLMAGTVVGAFMGNNPLAVASFMTGCICETILRSAEYMKGDSE